jgi:phosphatidate cytidylyltransferase
VLRTRLITAVVLVPLVACGVLFLPTEVFASLLAMVLIPGLLEWGCLIPLRGIYARLGYTLGVVLLMWLVWLSGPMQIVKPVLLVSFTWWLWVLYWLSRPEIGVSATPLNKILKGIAGVLVMVPAWLALMALHGSGSRGPQLVLILLVMIWLADSSAYFTGRMWGRRRLAPLISPGKTWEGVYGGLLASLLFAAIAGWFYSRSIGWTLAFLPVALLVVLFSIAGDLLESLMKRQCGVKDSGNTIPGHGGILDRIDSLLAAAPLFLLGLRWLRLQI